MSNYGIKVSEPGYDVFTAAEKNLALKSGMTLLKVYDEGQINIASQSQTVNHSLGYAPQYLAWVFNDLVFDKPFGDQNIYLLTGLSNVGYGYVTTTQLVLNAAAGLDLKAYYYIFYEQLNTGSNPPYTPTNDYGIKVSKDSIDVKEADILDQTFNSEKNSIKIADKGSETYTVNTSQNDIIAHGLDFVPGYLLYFEVNGSGKWWSVFEVDTLSGKGAYVNAYTNETYLIVEARAASSCSIKIKYYLFANPGN